MNSTNQLFKKLESEFRKNEDLIYAKKMERYMRNNFSFFGIKTAQRRKITSDILDSLKRVNDCEMSFLIDFLWQKKEREYQYFGIDLLKIKTDDFNEDSIYLLEKTIINKPWWDSVDSLSKNVNSYFEKFPHKMAEVNKKWINSENIWLQRVSLIFQLSRKDKTDKLLLFKNIKKTKNSNQFFIKKAIGWSLREYAKTDPDEVKKFILEEKISGLSKREALKHLKEI